MREPAQRGTCCHSAHPTASPRATGSPAGTGLCGPHPGTASRAPTCSVPVLRVTTLGQVLAESPGGSGVDSVAPSGHRAPGLSRGRSVGPRPHPARGTPAALLPPEPGWQVAAPGPVGPVQRGRTRRPGWSALLRGTLPPARWGGPGGRRGRRGRGARRGSGRTHRTLAATEDMASLRSALLREAAAPMVEAPAHPQAQSAPRARRRHRGSRAARGLGPGTRMVALSPPRPAPGHGEPGAAARTGGDAPPTVTSGAGRGPAVRAPWPPT